ncbi:MAG: hypothetical protein HY899_04975 [Deltaproteobacteria bacterium]|nr:hypothetical protein [Deltaproteobacteria bacterium]
MSGAAIRAALVAAVFATWAAVGTGVSEARESPLRRSPAVNTKADDGPVKRPPYGPVELRAAPGARAPSSADDTADDDVTDVKVRDDEPAPTVPDSPAGSKVPAATPLAAPPAAPARAPVADPAATPATTPARSPAATDAAATSEPPAGAADTEVDAERGAPAVETLPPPAGGGAGAAPAVAGEAAQGDAVASPPTTMPVPEVHEKTETKTPSLLTRQDAPKKKLWEAANGGFTASRFAVQRRLSTQPTLLLAPRSSIPTDPRAFLWRVAFDTWRGLEALTDRDSGLPIDNVHFAGRVLTPMSIKVGDYTSITNIGLQLAAIAAASRLGFILDDVAQLHATRLLDTLSTLEKHNGYFFNYYDTTSLEPTSSFISFVDTSWLVTGLLITRQAFPDLATTVGELLEPIDFAYFYNARDNLMAHGYYVNLEALSVYQYGAFYTEARLGSLIAIGKGDAPIEHWYAMRRAFRPTCSEEQRCPDLHELAYTARNGRRMHVHYFNWGNHRYVPSWGGSMFEALMPRLVLDEAHWAPRSLGPNGEAHAVVQELYAREILDYPVWGMSPAIDPDSGRYGEFGVPVLGSHGYSPKIVAPYAAALALAVAPDDATANLMEIARRYDIYGEFGFYDAVNPVSGKVSYSYLALDQAMLFLSLANHLTGGYLQDLFEADPFVRPALPLLAEERFFR